MSSVGTLGLNQVASVVIRGPVCAYLSVCLGGLVLTLFLTLQYKFVVRILFFYPISCFSAHRIVFRGTLPCKLGVVSVSYFIRCFCPSVQRVQYFDTLPCDFFVFHFMRLVFDSLPLFPLYIFNFVLHYPVSLVCVRFVFCHLLLPLHASCFICCRVCVLRVLAIT